MVSSISLLSEYRYIRIGVHPTINEALSLRKLLEDAMCQSFGVSRASTYIDVLSISKDGSETVIRIRDADADALMAAVVVVDKPVRLSVIKQSSFLPAVIADEESWIQQTLFFQDS